MSLVSVRGVNFAVDELLSGMRATNRLVGRKDTQEMTTFMEYEISKDDFTKAKSEGAAVLIGSDVRELYDITEESVFEIDGRYYLTFRREKRGKKWNW